MVRCLLLNVKKGMIDYPNYKNIELDNYVRWELKQKQCTKIKVLFIDIIYTYQPQNAYKSDIPILIERFNTFIWNIVCRLQKCLYLCSARKR